MLVLFHVSVSTKCWGGGGGGERFGSDVGLGVYIPACYLCGLWISCSVT